MQWQCGYIKDPVGASSAIDKALTAKDCQCVVAASAQAEAGKQTESLVCPANGIRGEIDMPGGLKEGFGRGLEEKGGDEVYGGCTA
jgi:hypothetical protein